MGVGSKRYTFTPESDGMARLELLDQASSGLKNQRIGLEPSPMDRACCEQSQRLTSDNAATVENSILIEKHGKAYDRAAVESDVSSARSPLIYPVDRIAGVESDAVTSHSCATSTENSSIPDMVAARASATYTADAEDDVPMKAMPDAATGQEGAGLSGRHRVGRWTIDEKILFLYGLQKFGKGRWKKISLYLPDR